MFSRWLIAGMVGLLALHTTAVVAGAQLLDTLPWPTFQHDNFRTGQSNLPGPTGVPVSVKWSHKAVNWPKTQPAVTGDTVYYAAGFQALCAVNAATGAKKWCGPSSGDANSSSPAIGESIFGFSHTIYRGARDNKLWSVNPNGTANFALKIPLDGDIVGSVAIGPDGTVYAHCGCLQKGDLWAVNPDGTAKWPTPLSIGQPINNSAVTLRVIGGTVRLYVGAANGELFAIDDLGASGQVAWRKKASGATQNKNSSPSIRQTATQTFIYLGSNAGLTAFRDDGSSAAVLWTRATAGAVDTTAAISDVGSGLLVVSSFKSPPATRTVYFLDLNGNPAAGWPALSGPSTQTSKHAQSPSAAIDVNGNVYQAVGKWVHAFGPNGAALWSHLLPADAISMALGNGVLYVGAKDSRLYALD